jgi:hypothetical protein
MFVMLVCAGFAQESEFKFGAGSVNQAGKQAQAIEKATQKLRDRGPELASKLAHALKLHINDVKLDTANAKDWQTPYVVSIGAYTDMAIYNEVMTELIALLKPLSTGEGSNRAHELRIPTIKDGKAVGEDKFMLDYTAWEAFNTHFIDQLRSIANSATWQLSMTSKDGINTRIVILESSENGILRNIMERMYTLWIQGDSWYNRDRDGIIVLAPTNLGCDLRYYTETSNSLANLITFSDGRATNAAKMKGIDVYHGCIPEFTLEGQIDTEALPSIDKLSLERIDLIDEGVYTFNPRPRVIDDNGAIDIYLAKIVVSEDTFDMYFSSVPQGKGADFPPFGEGDRYDVITNLDKPNGESLEMTDESWDQATKLICLKFYRHHFRSFSFASSSEAESYNEHGELDSNIYSMGIEKIVIGEPDSQ